MIYDPDMTAAVRQLDSDGRRDLWEFFSGVRCAARRDDATELLTGYYGTVCQLPESPERTAMLLELRRLIANPPLQHQPLT